MFFRGGFSKIISFERVEDVLDDMKTVTAETAFVVRTFFFILFGWSVYLGSLFSFKVIGLGLLVLAIIYICRAVILFMFEGKSIFLRLFLAPRGLITILLFFAIPKHLVIDKDFEGVLLFVVLGSCLLMTWVLISNKKTLQKLDSSKEKIVEDEIEGFEDQLPEEPE